MLEMIIDCPGCASSLKVPQSASGRRARCPACQVKFVVPSPKELLEETVSHWIVEDIDRMDKAEGGSQANQGSANGTLMGVPVQDSVHEEHGSSSTTSASSETTTVTLPEGMDAGDSDDEIDSDISMIDVPDTNPDLPVDAQKNTATETSVYVEALAEQKQSAENAGYGEDDNTLDANASPDFSTDEAASAGYAQREEISVRDRPLLQVVSCSQSGVVIEFSSQCLKNEAFRASMPMRGVFTGSDDRNDLVARPMVFYDQYKGHDNKSVHAIESHYERRPTAMQSGRDLLRHMRTLDDMTPPFNLPMLYYVNRHHTNRSLQCQAKRSTGIQRICEVLIPDGRVALDWVGRVNGICGADYETLMNDVAMQGTDAWRRLPEKTRERLEAWCKFQPREQFLIYVNDADFSSGDAGLAGVVITDQRLIYHKYHHSGFFPLNREGTLHVKTDGKVARLALAAKGRLARIGKINMKYMTQLIQTLTEYAKLKIELAAGE